MTADTRYQKRFNVWKILFQINFDASVIFLVIASIMTAAGSPFFFDDDSDLYGPMAGNLRLMLVYLTLMVLAVYSYCRFSTQFQGLLVLGVFLLLLTVSVEFYSTLNQVPVDENYRWLFLYLGLSHLAFGGITVMQQNRTNT